MARLVIFDDRVRGMELPGRPVLIGRSRKNDLPINDGLLSRKHCSVVPMGTGYRLMDLKSSNGTYLNGKRIEKVDLHVDDIIEIGHTVIVFLEDGVWSRGEGLASLRNPLKAQELIARIKLHHRSGKGHSRKIPLLLVSSRPPAGLERGRRARRTSRKSPPTVDPRGFPDLPQALEDFIVQRVVLVLSRNSADLRRIVEEVLWEALRPDGDGAAPQASELRSRVRAALLARLAAGGKAPGAAEGEKPAAGAEGGRVGAR